MALWKFGHFKHVSKISQKLFELGAWNLVDYLLNVWVKSKIVLWNYDTTNSDIFRDKQMLGA